MINALEAVMLTWIYFRSRGADRAEIYSICFSPTAPLLACSSDKGTVHVFSLTAEGSGHSFSSDPTTMGNVPSQSAPSHFSAGSAPRSGDDDGTENSKSRYVSMCYSTYAAFTV